MMLAAYKPEEAAILQKTVNRFASTVGFDPVPVSSLWDDRTAHAIITIVRWNLDRLYRSADAETKKKIEQAQFFINAQVAAEGAKSYLGSDLQAWNRDLSALADSVELPAGDSQRSRWLVPVLVGGVLLAATVTAVVIARR